MSGIHVNELVESSLTPGQRHGNGSLSMVYLLSLRLWYVFGNVVPCPSVQLTPQATFSICAGHKLLGSLQRQFASSWVLQVRHDESSTVKRSGD